MNLNSATKVASGTFDAAGNPITKAVNNSAGAINNALDSIAGVARWNNAYSASQAEDLRSWQEEQNKKEPISIVFLIILHAIQQDLQFSLL